MKQEWVWALVFSPAARDVSYPASAASKAVEVMFLSGVGIRV